MELGIVGQALEREHHEIDAGFASFLQSQEDGAPDPQPLQQAIDALRRHIYLEEEFLFPPMQESLAIPTLVMLREHGEIWRALDAAEAQLASIGDGSEAAEICRWLLAHIDLHNQKEEPIFYTQTDQELDGEQNAELTNLIETGAMPAGWVCSRAIVEDRG